MVMKCFCPQYYWNIRQPLTMYCTSIPTLPTLQCSTKVWWTIQDILWHTLYSDFVDHSRHTSAKMTNRLWCKLSALSKYVKLFDKLWISLREVPFSIEPTARLLYFILIQPKRWHFCDIIKFFDCCWWKYEYTQGEKHLASCATCKTGSSTLSLRINKHPY